ncbi:MAG: hypothetical protein DRH24_14090, partial [Deltaproteobacteria bacterium]
MSFPEKEAAKTLEYWYEKQTRIYGDACDMGLWSNPELKQILRQACRRLAKVYKGKTTRWVNGSSWECFIPFEQEGKQFVGAFYRVSYNRTRRRKAYFSIDIFKAYFSIDIFKETRNGEPDGR